MRRNPSRSRYVACWLAQSAVAASLLATLFFKLNEAEESVWIFTRLGLEPWGRIGSSVVELAAGVMLLVPATALVGALLALTFMLGALAAHLTVLGVEVQGDGGMLFALACFVLAGSVAVIWLRRDERWVLGRRLRQLRGVRVRTLMLAGLALGLALPSAAVEPVHTSRFGDLALGGYDAVTYFTEDRPRRGSREFEQRWQGAVWRFANEENRARFAAEPERFAPRYGGYCAWAVSRGYTASGDPLIWKIVDDKLYLNYNKKARQLWEQDIPGNIARADESWPKLLADE